MRVQSNLNNNKSNVNFKSIYLIKVQKTAFKNCNFKTVVGKQINYVEDLKAINKEFNKALIKSIEVPGSFLHNIWSKIKKPIASYLECPLIDYLAANSKRRGHASLIWLQSRADVKIQAPLEKNYHSFFLFTKNDIANLEKAKKAFSPKSYIKFLQEASKELPFNINMKPLDAFLRKEDRESRALINSNNDVTKQLELLIDKNKIEKFMIKDLSELPNVVKTLLIK